MERSLRRTDYRWLVLLCSLMFGVAIVDDRVLTTHEATHAQNVREMFESGNYLIPTYGQRPWLERPPVPHWLTGLVAVAVADPAQAWALRLGSVLMGTIAVLVWGWAIASALGRQLGFISAVVLATVREFPAYATGPEADIFIASFVTIAGALFIRTEFGERIAAAQPTFFGKRSWSVLAFFVILGTTNAMKGPLFGTAFLGTSFVVYLLISRDWLALRRYVWCWGWLAYLAVGAAWPIFAYLNHPDVADVWMHDYGKRWNTNYIGEPAWYYLVQVPWNLFPWTIPVFVGLAVTWRHVRRERHRAWQFVWCWALVPPVVFSCFKGKHHHYMLSCIAPQAVLGAVGAVAMWQLVERWPRWFRAPWFGVVVLGVPGIVLLFALKHKLPGPLWLPYVFAVLWLAVLLLSWFCVGHRNGRIALAGFVGVVVLVHVVTYLHRTRYLNSYEHDRDFLTLCQAEVPTETLYVLNEPDVLNPAWLLYYLGPQAKLLHNDTFLASEKLTAPAIYLIARTRDTETLRHYGTPTVLNVSAKTRGERQPEDRYTLFRLQFKKDLPRYPEPPVNGMQATGRATGPVLPVQK